MNTKNIGKCMTKFPYITSRKMTVREALDFMIECRIRHLPVMDGQQIVGVVSDRDLRLGQSFSGPGVLLVEDVMVSKPYVVQAGTALALVCAEMAKLKIGSAIVVNEKDQILGIFTTTDALELLSQMLKESPSLEYSQYGIERFMPPMLMNQNVGI